ncbi:MAG: hypothetical protein ABJH75_11575, partial [Roseibium sp.]|uniref:hypothetical protein n=1 Tax=Roseibium sp. TaxID=1936156 RepID=UPI003297ADCE
RGQVNFQNHVQNGSGSFETHRPQGSAPGRPLPGAFFWGASDPVRGQRRGAPPHVAVSLSGTKKRPAR